MHQSRNVSRDELYALVWDTPVTRLAEQFALSGNGLAKICRRLDVPYPPRGYWARREAGKKVTQAALPAIRPGTRAQVTIAPSLPAPRPPHMPSELEEGLATARRLTAGLRVPGKLHQPIASSPAGSRSANASASRQRPIPGVAAATCR